MSGLLTSQDQTSRYYQDILTELGTIKSTLRPAPVVEMAEPTEDYHPAKVDGITALTLMMVTGFGFLMYHILSSPGWRVYDDPDWVWLMEQ